MIFHFLLSGAEMVDTGLFRLLKAWTVRTRFRSRTNGGMPSRASTAELRRSPDDRRLCLGANTLHSMMLGEDEHGQGGADGHEPQDHREERGALRGPKALVEVDLQ